MKALLTFLFFLLPCLTPLPAFAWVELAITNATNSQIINILAAPVPDGKDAFFLRLDLAPGATDQMEIPAARVNLRVDTGLELWFFDDVDLANVTKLKFFGPNRPTLQLDEQAGVREMLAGKIVSLLPAPGHRPVCELGRFHPGMTMSEVCAILDPDLAKDDNGAVLTGLGFGGLLWAARLMPESGGKVSEDSLLEHLELRRNFNKEDIEKILDVLARQGYTPWQAEFPGSDIDFASAQPESGDAYAQLEKALSRYYSQVASAETDEEARIMLAPADNLAALANSDEPVEDVQLFSLNLQPAANTMMLDVAAYRGGE